MLALFKFLYRFCVVLDVSSGWPRKQPIWKIVYLEDYRLLEVLFVSKMYFDKRATHNPKAWLFNSKSITGKSGALHSAAVGNVSKHFTRQSCYISCLQRPKLYCLTTYSPGGRFQDCQAFSWLCGGYIIHLGRVWPPQGGDWIWWPKGANKDVLGRRAEH